jgi:small-conductance mechanosensitive channel
VVALDGRTNGYGIQGEQMARKSKKKQAAVPYEFIQEVNKLSKDEIVKCFIQEENDLKAMKKVKREDEQISELASQIKDNEETIKDKIAVLKEEMKAIREEDEEFVELKENKKALEGGYHDEMKRRRAYRDYLYETMQRIYQE